MILQRLLLAGGAVCALFLAWLAVVIFAFGRGYGQPVAALLPASGAVLAVAVAMVWVVWRFWRGGFGQRRPRLAALGLAGLGLMLALWSALHDPGDAVFMVPVLLGMACFFALMAAQGGRSRDA